MLPNVTSFREHLTTHSWFTVVNHTTPLAPPAMTPMDNVPPALGSLPRQPAALQPRAASADARTPSSSTGRTPTVQDFDAPLREWAASPNAVIERIHSVGRAGKSSWVAMAVSSYKHANNDERARLLMEMARNGFTPAEAAAAKLRFPGQALARSLVAFAQEGQDDWKRHLAHEIRHGIHLLHRGIGHRELDAALARGDVASAEALRAAGFHHTVEPYASYHQSAREGGTQVLEAAIAGGLRFDRSHRVYANAAARRGDLAFVRMLHENGMPLDQRGQANPVLWNAVDSGNRYLVDYLLYNGARANLQDFNTEHPHTLMQSALEQGDLPMAEVLMRHGYQMVEPEQAAYDRLRQDGVERAARREPTTEL